MPQKTSSPFWFRFFLILGSLTAFFAAISVVSAQKPEYSLFNPAPVNIGKQESTNVTSAVSPAPEEAQKKKTTADLPTRRYGLELQRHQISLTLDALTPAEMERATPNHIGIGRKVETLSNTQGSLIENADGTRLRIFGITSRGASAIRVHFEDFDLPEGDEVYVYGLSAEGHIAGPYSGKGIFKDGEFWADSVEGDTAIIEHYIRGEERALRIPEISHYFRNIEKEASLNVLPCQNDATCFSALENNTVGRITFIDGGDSLLCSGTILVDRNRYFPSLFLTANHCVSTEQTARTVEAFWFYQSASCNGTTLRSDVFRTVTGATQITTNAFMDSSLIRFLNPLPPNLIYSGWSPALIPVGTSVFGLHHPDGFTPPSATSRLRRSFGQISSQAGSCLSSGYRVNWTSGSTEGGSSGSGIWVTENNNNFLVGVLSCGPNPTCGTGNFDNYGKFSDFFPAIQPFISGAACSPTPIALGQTVTGQLNGSDCQARKGLARRYTFNGSAGQQVQVSLESASFDTFLSLLAPNQGLIAENDDIVGSTNSRIPATGMLTLPVTGTYTIEISSFLGNSAGGFTLRLNAQANPPIEVGVDDGSFETSVGLTNGGTDFAVNRITPPSYPATLTDVTIFFDNEPGAGINVGAPIAVIAGANPSGSSNINNIALQSSPDIVRALGQFIVYDIPDITIASGDFVLGFRMTYPAGVFPTSLDRTPPFRRRSYISNNGTTFTIIDDLSANLAGNFGIRARISQGSPCTYNLSLASQSFGSGGGTGTVSVSTAANCSWTATSNATWITITSGASGLGTGSMFYSVLPNAGSARSGTITIAGQAFNISQSAGGLAVTNVDITGKKLFVFGREFASGAKILLNGIMQPKVSNDPVSPTTLLIAKKAGKNILRGQTVNVQVRNPNGVTSPVFPWTRP